MAMPFQSHSLQHISNCASTAQPDTPRLSLILGATATSLLATAACAVKTYGNTRPHGYRFPVSKKLTRKGA